MGANIAELNDAQRHFLNNLLPSLQPRPGKEHVCFVQIGANISKQTEDPIHPLIANDSWKGLLVEPLPHVFEELAENLKEIDGLTLLNKAASDKAGELTLYYPEGRTVLASVDPDTVRSHLVDKNAPLETVSVPCNTVAELIDEAKLQDVDVMVVDAEGHDAKIILSLDLAELSIPHFLFENKHVADEERIAVNKFLTDHNYLVIEMGSDTFATLAKDDFFVMMQGIFDAFRTMERRSMQVMQGLNQFTNTVLQTTPRS